jgi:hypothetical protein
MGLVAARTGTCSRLGSREWSRRSSLPERDPKKSLPRRGCRCTQKQWQKGFPRAVTRCMHACTQPRHAQCVHGEASRLAEWLAKDRAAVPPSRVVAVSCGCAREYNEMGKLAHCSTL